MQTRDDFYKASEPLVACFDNFSNKHGLTGGALPDHICYKCATPESFERIRALFEHECRYIYQSIISQRRIAIIGLKKPITTELGEVCVLELCDQKPDGSQVESFDHIEVYPVGQTYQDMVNTLAVSEKVVEIKRPHHTTHDIEIGEGFTFRCTQEPLVEKIKSAEFV